MKKAGKKLNFVTVMFFGADRSILAKKTPFTLSRCWHTFVGALFVLLYMMVPAIAAPTQYYKDKQLPQLPSGIQQLGYVPFVRGPLRLIFPTTVPAREEIGGGWNIFMTPGETRNLTFSIRGLRDIGSAKIVASQLSGASGIIAADNFEIRVAVYGVREGQRWWGKTHAVSMVVPMYLSRTSEIDVVRDLTGQVWITLSLPQDTKPGHYQGTLIITPEKGDEYSIKLELEVLPIILDDVSQYFLSVYSYISKKREVTFYENAYADIRDHGLTSLAIMGDLGEELELHDGRAVIKWSGRGNLETALEAYKKVNFPNESVLWLMAGNNGGDIYPWCQQQEQNGVIKFTDCYQQVVEQILDRARTHDWPDIIFQPIDESFGKQRRQRIAKNTLPILKSIPGLRTEINDVNNKRFGHLLWDIYQWADVLTFHGGPFVHLGTFKKKEWNELYARVKHDGKEIWFYNIDNTGWHPEPMRFAYGFGLFASGGQGMLQWSYQVPLIYVLSKEPGKLFELPQYHLLRYPDNLGLSGGPTVGYEAIREGINDLKYIVSLKRVVDLAINSNDLHRKEKAKKIWKEVEKEIDLIDFQGVANHAAQGKWERRSSLDDGSIIVSGDLKLENGLEFEDYDRIRRKIAEGIMQLDQLGVDLN